jgi:N-acetylmuramoyl-L-alanine amidase
MRRGVVVLAALAFASPAKAQTPAATAEPTAPLTVAFRASTPAQSYRWDFGDGTTGEGAVVEHVYAEAGIYSVTLTTDGGQTSMEAVAYRVAFEAPARATLGSFGRFTGSIWPAVAGAPVVITGESAVVARGKTRPNGGFVIRARVPGRGPFRARVHGLLSGGSAVLLRPKVEARFVGSGIVGDPLRLRASVKPGGAGTLHVTVWRDGRRTHSGRYERPIGLRTKGAASYRIRVELRPAVGFLAATRVVRTAVMRPNLAMGARGPSVRALEQRLRELRYALPRVDGAYRLDTYQAVLAFQKVEALPRTGRVDARTWRALRQASPPRARHSGTHIEVSKGRQVLFVVRDGRVTSAVHVSTGVTGNTPIGRWRIYRKVTGWDWVLWYPMYFLRGFAIHGYPEVPAYPASHGCVRVPMWIASSLFGQHSYGQTVYIYW